ncbi:MAG TPA: AAA family ATPase, partial [Coleofasciculaceae cyanobacterium]
MRFDPEFCRNESEVESKLIVQYLLPELGYTPDTWHQEVAFGSIRLDFLAFATQVLPFVLDANSPLSLVIEAKHPQEKLDKHIYRLKSYLTRLGTKYGVLTNGRELRIYQNIGNQVTLLFQCSGQEISDKIAELRALIGKDCLHETWSQKSVSGQDTSAHSQDKPIKEKARAVKVIAIYHNKGGVGKTTVSINLAAALRRKGHQVLLIDLDSQANSTYAAGLVKFQFEEDDNLRERNICQVLESAESFFIPEIVRQSDFFNTPELDVVPAHVSLIDLQTRLNQIGAARTRLVKKLQQVEQDYDFVIIDTPP